LALEVHDLLICLALLPDDMSCTLISLSYDPHLVLELVLLVSPIHHLLGTKFRLEGLLVRLEGLLLLAPLFVAPPGLQDFLGLFFGFYDLLASLRLFISEEPNSIGEEDGVLLRFFPRHLNIEEGP